MDLSNTSKSRISKMRVNKSSRSMRSPMNQIKKEKAHPHRISEIEEKPHLCGDSSLFPQKAEQNLVERTEEQEARKTEHFHPRRSVAV